MTQKITNFINQLRDYSNNAGVSIKHACLLLIAIVSLLLIVFGRNGFDFGVVALACWIFAFLDLARIKFKDCEIDFMTRKQALTADERLLYVENYELMEKFMFEFMKESKIDDQTYDYISKATKTAYLLLNPKLAMQLDEYLKVATRVYFIDKKIKLNEEQGSNTTKFLKEKNEYLGKLYNINLVDLYRPYVKVKDDAKK